MVQNACMNTSGLRYNNSLNGVQSLFEYQWIETKPLSYSSHSPHTCASPNGVPWQESVAGAHDQGVGNWFPQTIKQA